MPPENRRGVFFDLSGRAILRVTGNDRLRFLNGQITNNVSKATDTSAIAACVLNVKGRMNGHVFISATRDCFFIDADPSLRESLKARLERYIIADEVEIEDVSEQFSIFHLLVTAAPEIRETVRLVSVDRFGRSGVDVVVDHSRRDEVLAELSSSSSLCDEVCAELFRIEQGIPRWGRELTDEIIPIEANLEESCVDYEKGCYIGQEVISRIKMSGQQNKKLCGLRPLTDVTLAPGMRLLSTAEKEVGWITSVVHSDRVGRDIALGYVKRGFNNADSELDALESGSGTLSPVRLIVVNLPFVPQKEP